MEIEAFIARGHQIISEGMAKARAAEQALHKNTAVSAHVEACLRDLWSLLMNPGQTDAERTAEKHAAIAEAEEAVAAELNPPAPPPAPVPAQSPVTEAVDPAPGVAQELHNVGTVPLSPTPPAVASAEAMPGEPTPVNTPPVPAP